MISNKKIAGSAAIIFIFIVFVICGYYLTKPGGNDISVVSETKAANKSQTDNSSEVINTDSLKKVIKAQIFGEVNRPGVYTLKMGDRVKDLIDIAGGFTDKADNYSVNGAKKLVDGDNVEIKCKKQDSSIKTGSTNQSNNVSTTGTGEISEKLDINSATEADIVNKKISGIGKGLAAKIIQFRESNGGRINSQKDLEKAIGPKRAEKMMNYIEIN